MAWTSDSPTLRTTLKTIPTLFTANMAAFEDFTGDQHVIITTATTSGKHIGGKASVLMADVTATIAAISSPPPCAVAWDTTLRVLKYYSGSAWVNVGGTIPTGTVMVVNDDTAPTGWTIENTLDDKVVYITKGSAAGGQTGGGVHSTGTWTIPSHTHATQSHTLTIAEMPAHTHSGDTTGPVGVLRAAAAISFTAPGSQAGTLTTVTTHSAGSSTSHAHGDVTGAASDGSWRFPSSCSILCTKD